MPIVDPKAPIRVALAQFGLHRLSADEQLVCICPADDGLLRTLEQQMRFYELDGRIVVSEEKLDVCAAMELGIRATQSATLLLLAPGVYGAAPGWTEALTTRLHALSDGVALSPSILYEDYSVRFAGIETVAATGASPYVVARSRAQGYPRSWLAGKVETPVLAASLECCALSRDTFLRTGGFSRGYALPGLKGLDFFLQLAAEGGQSFWTPTVEVYGLDGEGGETNRWMATGQLVDGWSFRQSWSSILAASL
jgi:hypothetical protein